MEKDECKAIMDKEIDLIQGCISRMAQNSFIIKGWAITLVAVALPLQMKQHPKRKSNN